MRRGDNVVGRLRVLLIVQCARRTYPRAARRSDGCDLHRAVRNKRGRDGGPGRRPGLSLRSSPPPAGQQEHGAAARPCGDRGAGGAVHTDSATVETRFSPIPRRGNPCGCPSWSRRTQTRMGRPQGTPLRGLPRNSWREREGVEPTAPTAGLPPDGFEDRESHQALSAPV